MFVACCSLAAGQAAASVCVRYFGRSVSIVSDWGAEYNHIFMKGVRSIKKNIQPAIEGKFPQGRQRISFCKDGFFSETLNVYIQSKFRKF